jgi:integrase
MRERRPGVWEIRVVVANDQLTGRSVQRSFTVRGDREVVEARRRDLVERFGLDRGALYCESARWSVAELLDRWASAEHQWRPATRASHVSVVRYLRTDRLGGMGLAALAPRHVEDAFARWRAAGGSVALVWRRWAVLHSALAWATRERLLRSHPIEAMRAPPRATPRLHLTPDEVAQLLEAADNHVDRADKALAETPENGQRLEGLFVAEQTRLLVRLAADSAARRGELAVLRRADLSGRVLSIERGVSLDVIGPTKSSRTRRLTLGATTAAMVEDHLDSWEHRVGTAAVAGDWIFAPDYRRLTHARPDLLSHRFERLRRVADLPDASLHRLRHSVGTYLVGRGQILRAQARLGHRDPATTLRHYAHALPLDDEAVADELDDLLNGHNSST